jgi:hypothetical protein
MDELMSLFYKVYEDGNTLIALKEGHIAGVMFSRIQRKLKDENFHTENNATEAYKTELVKEYLRFSSQVNILHIVCIFIEISDSL